MAALLTGLLTALTALLPALDGDAAATPAPAVARAAAAPATPRDLADLQARLATATGRAQQLAAELEQARSRDGGRRAALEALREAQDAAQRRLDTQVREAYVAAPRLPRGEVLEGWARLTDPDAALPPAYALTAGARATHHLVREVEVRRASAAAAAREAEGFREGLRAQATAVLAEQDAARTLLAEVRAELVRVQQARTELARAEQARAEQARVEQARVEQTRAQQEQARQEQARQAEQSQQEQARVQRAQQEQAGDADGARLSQAQTALDAVSATVTRALTPAQTGRGREAQQRAEPVLRLLEATGSGYPAGYRRTGRTVTGTASWYGPGLVGSPTATGRPYDPERLSCASKELPLWTVLHVTANGRAVNCLVDDRGPYVGDRVLDLSRAASRALGYDGTAEVVAEVLAHTS